MSADRLDVLIVGAGKAGDQLAASLRDEGFDGSIRILGDESHAPYDRPPLSKAFLLENEPESVELRLRSPGFYEERKIEIETGVSVERLDLDARRATLMDGRELEYGELVLATGSRVRPLPFAGATLKGVSGLRDVADATRIRAALRSARSLVVIGGGFIGLEIAAAAVKLDVDVTVVEALPRLMSRTALAETAEFAREYHTSLGVKILLGVQVAEIRSDESGHVVAVVTGDGTVLPADAVVYGIGVDPRTEVAVDSGLEIANGILVDESLAASAANVWAIGDCAAFPSEHFGGILRLESVQNATDQARFLADELVSGRRSRYQALPWFWSDQNDMAVKSVGILNSHDLTVVVGNPTSGSFSTLAFKDGVVIGGDSVNAASDHLALRRLLNRPSQEWRAALTPERVVAPGFSLKEFANHVAAGAAVA